MATYQLNVNGQRKQVDADPSTPLLWVLREELKMTGTKYGCGNNEELKDDMTKYLKLHYPSSEWTGLAVFVSLAQLGPPALKPLVVSFTVMPQTGSRANSFH